MGGFVHITPPFENSLIRHQESDTQFHTPK